MRRIGILTTLLGLIAGPAFAAPPDVWEIFHQESIARYASPGEAAQSWEDVLWRAYDASGEPEAAARAFARSLDLEVDAARQYADLIANSSVGEACRLNAGRFYWSNEDDGFYGATLDDGSYEHDLDDAAAAAYAAYAAGVAATAVTDAQLEVDDLGDGAGVHPACQALVDDRPLERARTTLLAEPTGELLSVIIERELDVSTSAQSMALVLEHPNALGVLRRLFQSNEDIALQLALMSLDPTSEETVQTLTTGLSRGAPTTGPAVGWAEAILEAARARAAGTAQRRFYDRALLMRSLDLGLADYAVAIYREVSPEDRSFLITDPTGTPQDSAAVVMAAALWLAGDRSEALTVLDAANALQQASGERPGRTLAAMNEALRPTLQPADLFQPFVLGAEDATDENDHFGDSSAGWIFASWNPLVAQVLAGRLEEAGYHRIADTLRRPRAPYGPSTNDQAQAFAATAARLGPETTLLHAAWVGRLRDALEGAAGADGPQRFSTPALPAIWTEGRLPPGLAPWLPPTGQDAYDAEGEPAPFTLPEYISPYGLIRAERIGEERVALFESSEYDLPGEIPAYGLWLVRTRNNVWQPPVYLGLQTLFPYVPARSSALPLLDGDRLQMEVQVRELDPETITFPPVGLGYLRQEDGIVLSAALADLERDTDSDGITDIAERRLGLDPDTADSDGDGWSDDRDPLPGVPYNPAANPRRTALAQAILEAIVGHDAGAIMIAPTAQGDPLSMLSGPPQQGRWLTVFLAGDATDYAALVTPFRLIVRTQEDFEAANAGGPPFFPPVVTVYSSLDDRTHLVIWSASWVGGAFVVRCADEGGCESEEISSWIT